MAQQTYFLFSPTPDFPFQNLMEVRDAVQPHNQTADNIKVKMEQARQCLIHIKHDNVSWAALIPLLDELDGIFEDVLHDKRDDINMRLLIGMNDSTYSLRMATYYS